jgi:pimeloyl-ACP methyl ester carboxylesterase
MLRCETDMTAQPSPRQLSVAAADGCHIKVTQRGRGQEALILVHGFGENAASWGELPPDITSVYSVLSVDLRGHGDSQWDPRAQYRLDKFVSDLALLLDQLRIHSFCMAGHSLGASIALRLATLRPRHVRKLVLVEFNLDATPDDVLELMLAQFDVQFRVYHSPAEYHAFLETQRPVADRGALLRYAQQSLRPRQGGGYEIKCDPELRRLHCDFRDPGQSPRNRDELSRLSCPLLLVRGAGSAILTKAAAQQIVNLAPNAQLALVQGAGHSVMLDRPKEFAEIMARFLPNSRS